MTSNEPAKRRGSARVGELALDHRTEHRKKIVMRGLSRPARREQVQNMVDSFNGRIAVSFRLAADSIIGRRWRFETDPPQTRQILAQTEHFSHALPRPVQDKYD